MCSRASPHMPPAQPISSLRMVPSGSRSLWRRQASFRCSGSHPPPAARSCRKTVCRIHGNVVVISDGLWRRDFGGATSTIGSVIQLSGGSFTVVGIMPPGLPLSRRDGGLDPAVGAVRPVTGKLPEDRAPRDDRCAPAARSSIAASAAPGRPPRRTNCGADEPQAEVRCPSAGDPSSLQSLSRSVGQLAPVGDHGRSPSADRDGERDEPPPRAREFAPGRDESSHRTRRHAGPDSERS